MKKAVFLAMIQIFISLSMFSQYYFYVSPSSERTKPSQQEKGMSNDETLNQIFKEFEVKSRVNAYKAVQAACATVSPAVNFTGQTVTANTTVTGCGDICVRNVTVTNGAKLTLKAAGATVIGSNFTVDPGSQPEIK